MNPYEKAREERIKRNNAMLAQLEIPLHAQKLAAPVAAAAEAEAKKLADKRARLAAVEPRQRSKRSSAAQAKAALSKQAKALERGSDSSGDAANSDDNSGELSADGMSTGRRQKRKANADLEDDYDPLEDHSDAQNMDSSASEAEASAESSDEMASRKRPGSPGSMVSRHKQGQTAHRQSTARRRETVYRRAYTTPEPSESEEGDFELQQALAMSLLDRQPPNEPEAARALPAAANARPVQAPASDQLGYSSKQEASVKMEIETLNDQPEALTLDVDDIESAEGEAGDLRVRLPDSSGAAKLQDSAGGRAAGKGRAGQAKLSGPNAEKGKAAIVTIDSEAVKGRKRPAKGKAIEIYDPTDIGKAFDLISNGASSIREHMLQKVWDDVRGGKLDQLACNNMLTFAADITGKDNLDRAAFSKLCEHFTS